MAISAEQSNQRLHDHPTRSCDGDGLGPTARCGRSPDRTIRCGELTEGVPRDAGELDQTARPLGLAESSIRELPPQRASDDRKRPRIGNAARRRA